MKITITGCNGQLGSELQKILRNGVSELGNIPETLMGAELDCIDIGELDITDFSASLNHTLAFTPDIIINCAAFTNVDMCETHEDEAYRVNAIGARNMAVCAERVGAKMIHISTDYVFPGNAEKPYSEYDMPDPKSVYGLTKLAGENFVRDFSTKWFIVRTSWLYGYKGGNFVKKIMSLAKEQNSIKVVADQIGNPTNAADLAHHILKIAAAYEYGLYHCTGSGECSWHDFAVKIIEYAGINTAVYPCRSAEYPSRVKRPSYSSLDHRMLRLTVGDEMRKWQDALKYFIEHYGGE
jgi:dTDP-4-dehydrorhamnose reductase